MIKSKDFWDKADIILRAMVPVAVGVLLLLWNNQRTAQQTSATMTEIAIGILSEKPEGGSSNALRKWAIEVLRNPSDPPLLTDSAALTLELDGFPTMPSRVDLLRMQETEAARALITGLREAFENDSSH